MSYAYGTQHAKPVKLNFLYAFSLYRSSASAEEARLETKILFKTSPMQAATSPR